ncbi:MAG: serine hydrolase domain-containing protein [Betaproteobacteria bacterium]
MTAFALGAGCAHAPTKSLLEPARFAEIDQAIISFIDAGKLPGAVFYLERTANGDQDFYQKAFGRYTFEADAPRVTADTLFDAASLTKVLATTPSIMLLLEDGKLSLDAPLVSYLPECASGGKESITLRHLLTHTSGLPSGLPAHPPWRGEAAALERACAQTVTHPPGSFFRYSDINFILLGFVVQRVSGMPLNEFAQQRLFVPLRMNNTGYLPLRKFAAARVAPTQKIDHSATSLHGDVTGTQIQGVVHDPTVRFMGGVGGSAGVFTTASDIARYARMLLNEGELDGVRVLSRNSVRLMSTVQSPPGVEWRRSAGFDIDSPYSRPRGALFPLGSFGHTGFTGCILWIDPFSKTFYVFLSNRVYPDDKANILELYSRLGTLAAGAVKDGDFHALPGVLPRATHSR